MSTVLCPYFGRCGGCLYQDLPAEAYVARKESFIRRAFQDQGLTPSLERMIRIPIGTRRRACFAFHRGHVGFNAAKSHAIVDIEACPLLTPALSGFIPVLREFVGTLNQSGDVFVLDTPQGLDIHIKSGKNAADLPLREKLAAFAGHPRIGRVSYNAEPIAEKVPFPFPPDVFLQPSAEGEKALVELALEGLGEATPIIDLFCGAGTFTRPLLARGRRVIGYDCDERAVKTLGTAGIARDLFRNPLMPEELNAAAAVIINPPRAGARAQAEALAASSAPLIVMVSCNPATAARDIKICLQGGRTLAKLTPVDQFVFSNHVELVAVLKKLS